MVTKFFGILPLTLIFRFDPKEEMYTTLLMSTGLTFGSISALFGLTNHIIDERQYTILRTAVIGSAVVPTMIAQRWFQPDLKPLAGRRAAAVEAALYERIIGGTHISRILNGPRAAHDPTSALPTDFLHEIGWPARARAAQASPVINLTPVAGTRPIWTLPTIDPQPAPR